MSLLNTWGHSTPRGIVEKHIVLVLDYDNLLPLNRSSDGFLTQISSFDYGNCGLFLGISSFSFLKSGIFNIVLYSNQHIYNFEFSLKASFITLSLKDSIKELTSTHFFLLRSMFIHVLIV